MESDEEPTRGRRALDRLRKWLRDSFLEHAVPKASDVSDEVDELVEFLYDDGPGPFGERSKGQAERSVGKVGAVVRRPTRRRYASSKSR